MFDLFAPSDDIYRAAQRGDLEAVRHFANANGVPEVADDINEEDINNPSLLTVACRAGHVSIVAYLLSCGAWHTWWVSPARAPHAWAAMEAGHLDVLRELCEYGLDEESTRWGKYGTTLIESAVNQRRADVVRLLMSYRKPKHRNELWFRIASYNDISHFGVDDYEAQLTGAELESEDGYPPIIEVAARCGDAEFVEFLLEIGLDLNGKTGEFYLEQARTEQPEFALESELQQKLFQQKLKAVRVDRAASAPKQRKHPIIDATWRVVAIPFAVMVAPVILLIAVPLFLWIKYGQEPKQSPP